MPAPPRVTRSAYTIDPEFAALMPPVPDTQTAELRADIAARGVLMPGVVWEETGILVDGHRRHDVCKSLGLELPTKTQSFPDRDAARLYAYRVAYARRNLTEAELSYVRGKLYVAAKKDGPGRPPGKSRQGDGITADRVAAQTGVSGRTIERDAVYVRALDKIAQTAGEDAKRAILTKEVGLTRADVGLLASREPKSLEDVEAFAAERDAARQRVPGPEASAERGYRTKSVIETKTYVGDDGETYVSDVLLSCTHWRRMTRLVKAPLGSKSFPCYTCGSGTRTPAERRQAKERADMALSHALAGAERADELKPLVAAALKLTSYTHPDARVQLLVDEIGRAARVAGLA